MDKTIHTPRLFTSSPLDRSQVISVRDRMCWLAEGDAYRRPEAFAPECVGDTMQRLRAVNGPYRSVAECLLARCPRDDG